MPITVAKNVLKLVGVVGVEDAFALKESFLALKREEEEVTLDMSELADFDFSLVQLLLAFKNEEKVSWVLPQREDLSSVLSLFGIC